MLIATENIFISILTLVPLHYKFSVSIKFVDVTVISLSEISLESYTIFFFLRKFSVSVRFVDVTVISR